MKTTTTYKSFKALAKLMLFGLMILLTLNSNAQCAAGFSFVAAPANDGDVTFTDTSPGGPWHFYQWNFGDGTLSNLQNPGVHNYSASATYNVCLTIQDSANFADSTMGCTNTYCTPVTAVNNFAPCYASFFLNLDSTGSADVYNTSSGSITDYFWDFGDGTTSTAANPGIHSYAVPGYYSICLTTTNPATSCNSTYCDTILISSCDATFGYTPDVIGNGCTFNCSYAAPGANYMWYFGDGATSTLQNPYHTYALNGYYNVCLAVTNSVDTICSDNYCQGLYMSGLCDAAFSIVQDSSNLYNYFIYNYSTSPAGTLTYLWDFGDGTTSTAMYPTHTYATTSPVVICLTISDGSCTDTHCDTVTPGMMMSGPFVVTVLPTGVQEQPTSISSFESFPNPFSDNTTIKFSISKDADIAISISDLLGNKVAELENGKRSAGEYLTNWNAEGIAGGMYLLRINAGNDTSVKKIIINR